MLLGLVWVLMGWAAVATERGPADPGLGLFHLLIPAEIRFTLWASLGLVAMATALWPKGGRWQTVGFIALLLMPIERSLSYAIGWAVYLLPIEAPGTRLGWTGAVLWAAFAGVIMIIAGWSEPTRLPPQHELAQAMRDNDEGSDDH